MTYSIVAIDSSAQQMGVAVQTALPFVGVYCPWAEAGVGVVATQALSRLSHGKNGLALMRGTHSAPQALAGVLAADPQAEVRQVAMLDATGEVAAHTGQNTIRFAGHQVGQGYSVQANMMQQDTVWGAMAQAFEAASGDLVMQILAALEAAQAEGGDVRGAQSVGLKIVPTICKDDPMEAFIFDIRVDDSATPLADLRRLITLRQAYLWADEAEGLLKTDFEAGMAHYQQALALAPQEDQLRFWLPLTIADELGRLDAVEPILRDLFQRQPKWVETLASYAAAYRLQTEGLLEQLIALGEK
jgi:uncharacterized Ntn-hydrolase superfamily protein